MNDDRRIQTEAERAEDGAGKRDGRILRALHSDESESFLSPCAPAPGQRVKVRLRVEREFDVQAEVLVGNPPSRIAMAKACEDDLFAWFEAGFACGLETLHYRYLVHYAGSDVVLQRDGAHWADDPQLRDQGFGIVPGHGVPAWAQGAVQYQIFPDRFANGNPENDVLDGEYAYEGAHVRHVAQWDAPPASDDYRCFYGGDLQGVMSKLDYLQSLGVEAVYLNPIFISPSSHKYDTQHFGHVDPHLAVICDDVDHSLEEGSLNNGNALQYVRRTTSRRNLEASDDYFAELCREIHRRGMRIILDGVFNHSGSFNAWMDREGVYQRVGTARPGAYGNADSPFRNYFSFRDGSTTEYEAWWDFPTLPKLNYEHSEELCDCIIGIARRWALPPYSIDGWRLDVAADVGHSDTFNHAFWRRFRHELKQVNPELVIIAEHYGNPAPWLQGDQWDTVMNYDAFMDPLSYFLTGMEKHSDDRNDALYQDGAEFCRTMRKRMARFGWGQLLCAMNELSNHDHSRFLTRTNRMVGRTGTAGPAAAAEGVDKRVMREAVVVQMTWPGAPTIYYGDEAGQVGWTDPDCRRTYPWGAEDKGLIGLHRQLAQIRREHPSLRSGSFVLLGGGTGWIAFGRFLAHDRVAVACNNADEEQVIPLRLRELGMQDGRKVQIVLQTCEEGFVRAADLSRQAIGTVRDGMLNVALPPRSAIILA
ncbi:MAG TPA: alpha-glycosidase [Eggerthellaceae bacterium]|nr:alpha-glycosidase [Eggerthellaceae bacterium]